MEGYCVNPSPGINSQALEESLKRLSGDIFIGHISVFALGIMPFISAYMIVEIFSLFLPPLKAWRTGGYAGRAKLRRTAFGATFMIALIQGYGIAHELEDMFGGQIVQNPGLSFRLISALTLATGTFIMIWIADLITKRGFGHGISVLVFAGFAAGLFFTFPKTEQARYDQSAFSFLLLLLFVGAVLISFVVLMEKSCRKIPVKFADGKEAFMPLKLTTAGTVPLLWASSVIMFPATIAGFIDNSTLQELSRLLSPNEAGYYAAYPVTIILVYYFFTSLFYHPEKMIAFLKNNRAEIVSPAEINAEDYIDRSLGIMALFGSVYLCILALIPEILIKFFNFSIFLGGVALIEAVAITLDLWREFRMRRTNESLVKVAEFHDVVKAGLARSLLEGQGIPCLLRGYYYRALFYFFGPYVEISVFVPEDRRGAASELINGLLNEDLSAMGNL